LLIADTHVGLEVELGKRGVRIPRQSVRIAQSMPLRQSLTAARRAQT